MQTTTVIKYVCVVFNARKCEHFRISFWIIFSYIRNMPLFNVQIGIAVISRRLLNMQNVLFCGDMAICVPLVSQWQTSCFNLHTVELSGHSAVDVHLK
jgi:hypothetical protein